MLDVNEEWLEAAREVLGTDTTVATINARELSTLEADARGSAGA
jgi:hypothetical protein